MSKLKKNFQQFVNWIQGQQQRESARKRARPSPQGATGLQGGSTAMQEQVRQAASQIGKDLQRQGVGQGQTVSRQDAPGVTPNMHHAKQGSGGSSWKYADGMRRQTSRQQKKGKRL